MDMVLSPFLPLYVFDDRLKALRIDGSACRTALPDAHFGPAKRRVPLRPRFAGQGAQKLQEGRQGIGGRVRRKQKVVFPALAPS